MNYQQKNMKQWVANQGSTSQRWERQLESIEAYDMNFDGPQDSTNPDNIANRSVSTQTQLGQKIIVHADHKNIAYGNLTNDCIIRWRLLLEEFGPKYEHIAGKDNVVADALSRMEMQPEKAHKSATEAGALAAYCMSTLIRDEAVEFHAHWANDEICRLR